MRRVALTVFSTALMLVSFPRPAAAWWEFLEELSGPGWWRGFDIDARLFCLVDPLPQETERELLMRMSALVNEPRPNRLSVLSDARDNAEKRKAFLAQAGRYVGDWKTSLDKWEELFDRWELAA